MTRYADTILPLALNALTYSIPEGLEVKEGDVVAVPMGQSRDRYYAAIVWRVHSTPPPYNNIKPIIKRLYSVTLLSDEQRRFWEWISSYYLCSLGEVMRCALPSLVKAQGEDEESFQLSQYQPRKESFISTNISKEAALEQIPPRAKSKRRAVEAIFEAIAQCSSSSIPRRLIDEPLATLRKLESDNLITIEKRELTQSTPLFSEYFLPKLSPSQLAANQEITECFKSSTTVLLHGVTGSGKSEIYMHQMAEALNRGGDVLLLIPEIALTKQLVDRMERVFGERVSLYHSRLSPRARTELYLQLSKSNGGNLVVGVRSAIFLPLKRLELIVVDEEHDPSYKQNDPQPRYNARDCAVAYASMFGVRTLLGSATPSLESWANAKSGKYGYITLNERHGGSSMAQIVISDTLRSVKRGERRGHLNLDLKLALDRCIEQGEQAILFQNRRGIAPYVECTECGFTPKCESCNVTLTLHSHRLECHYCGYSEPVAQECPKCGATKLKPMGFGTERVEQSICESMPDVAVARLDTDVASSPTRFKEVISKFENGDTQILIGTQMVTKGFDFAGVTLCGVLNADNLLMSPNFRAEERAYQLITQIAGRAGRRDKSSLVVIQSSQSEHRVLQSIAHGSYEQMAASLLEERALFLYPPYSRLIDIEMRHRDKSTLHQGAAALANSLRKIFSRRLLGPTPPPIDKIRDEYIIKMTLKIELGRSSMKARGLLRDKVSELLKDSSFKSIKVNYDVDPQ
ncbi:MAG: primosomal protein N' [Rikenellaceae bacterium]